MDLRRLCTGDDARSATVNPVNKKVETTVWDVEVRLPEMRTNVEPIVPPPSVFKETNLPVRTALPALSIAT